MKVLVEIDEIDFENLKRKDKIDRKFLTYYEKLIANGTPLPKGHGRLIDTDVLVDGREDDYEFCEAVNATPTIIEADGGDTE